LRTLDDSGTGSSKSAADALKWVLDNGNIHLVNMSLGSYTASADEERVLKQLEMAGVLVVCAAGNANTSEPFYPACYDSVLAVAAIDQQSHRANFSNYGPHLAISAPGVDCYSTYLSGQYRKLSGTSMATPIVTGLLALGMSYVLIKNPAMDKKALRQKVMTTLLESAKKLGDRVYFGAGGIDALSFINDLAV
jgi:subtilisin family serine protease